MGWKALKDFFQIGHQVQIKGNMVCIGSPYVHDLATVNIETGQVQSNRNFHGFLEKYYPKLKEATPEQILETFSTPDQFSASIPVYTYDGAEIIQKLCEAPDYPNVTHDGCMMYENTYSVDKAKVIEWAKRNAQAESEFHLDRIKNALKEIEKHRVELKACRSDLQSLESNYPS
jgi:hypothetical protein